MDMTLANMSPDKVHEVHEDIIPVENSGATTNGNS
jgi:hypothetical protein